LSAQFPLYWSEHPPNKFSEFQLILEQNIKTYKTVNLGIAGVERSGNFEEFFSILASIEKGWRM
jgi:hypothetical protein